jgi:hypothetical protein
VSRGAEKTGKVKVPIMKRETKAVKNILLFIFSPPS